MADEIRCPGCGQSYPHNAKLQGKKVKCKRCGQRFQVPVAVAQQIVPDDGLSDLADLDLGVTAEDPDWAARAAGPPMARPRSKATRRRNKKIINALLRAGGGLAVVVLLVWGIVLLVGSVFSGNSSAFSDSSWQTFRSEEHNFSALFPGEANLERDGGGRIRRATVWGLETETCDFIVWSIFDPGAYSFRSEDKAEDWLRNYASSRLKMVKKDIQEDKPVTLDGGHPGVDIRCDNPNPDDRIQAVYYRLYDVGGRIYCLNVRTTAAGRDDPGVIKFLDSFRLIEPVKGSL